MSFRAANVEMSARDIRESEGTAHRPARPPLCAHRPPRPFPRPPRARAVKNGHIKRITDPDIQSSVLEVCGSNVSTTYITCPADPKKTLGIKLPFLVMILKNLKKYFTFEVTVLDDKNVHRRFRASNYQVSARAGGRREKGGKDDGVLPPPLGPLRGEDTPPSLPVSPFRRRPTPPPSRSPLPRSSPHPPSFSSNPPPLLSSPLQSTTRVKPFICTMPMRLDDGWNQIQFNLADFTRRAYGSNYVETLRVQIHANCRIRRIYFSDRLYTEDELPTEFKLFVPVQKQAAAAAAAAATAGAGAAAAGATAAAAAPVPAETPA